MRIGVTFTVHNRPHYLKETLDSWANVRGVEDVEMYFNIEPTDLTPDNFKVIQEFAGSNLSRFLKVNSTKLGVLDNPFYSLDRAFDTGLDYVILAEDDLIVSDDILEYHKWASETYVDDKDLAMVCSFSKYDSHDSLEQSIIRIPNFASVWVWGTWNDRWNEYIKPTWDHDYSTSDWFDSGWDWHLNRRVLPERNKSSLQPMHSRVQHIGLDGTHMYEDALDKMDRSPVFQLHREPKEFIELGK